MMASAIQNSLVKGGAGLIFYGQRNRQLDHLMDEMVSKKDAPWEV